MRHDVIIRLATTSHNALKLGINLGASHTRFSIIAIEVHNQISSEEQQ